MSTIREVLQTLAVTIVIFLLVQLVLRNFRVEGTSMEPTLHDGELLIVNRAIYWSLSPTLTERILPSVRPEPDTNRVFLFHHPGRGDIIVFRYPLDPSRDFIKRVIGLPGDVVAVRDQRVFVNGQTLVEPYILEPPRYVMAPIRVPDSQYFVLGDNRNNSSDSHVWGTVPWSNIEGQTAVTYWPLGDWQYFPPSAVVSP